MWMILNGQTGILLVAIVCITIIVFTIIITRTIKYCSDKKYETIQEYNKVNTHNNETYADAKNKYIKTMKENDINNISLSLILKFIIEHLKRGKK